MRRSMIRSYAMLPGMRAWLVVVVACASTPKEETISIAEVNYCVPYAYYGLKMTSFPSETGDHAAFHAADGAAREHAETATTAADAKRYGDAARAFFACAVDYRAVPAGDPGLALALDNARACYGNAISAFANAGQWASAGRALVERAEHDDPRLADYLRDQVAKAPSDCAVR